MKNNIANKNQTIYINPQIIAYFNQTETTIKTSGAKLINNISELNGSVLALAVTNSCMEAVELKNKYNCSICFVNNHSNDCIDFIPTYEITKAQVPQQLQKILTRHQNHLKKNYL